MKPKVVFFTGAGISAESGIPTFRDKDGLWEGVDPMKMAHIDTWNSKQNRNANRELMLEFYNQRRRDLHNVNPNDAHIDIANFQKEGIADVVVITQNIDDLHERAGAENVIHLHGELFKARTTNTGEIMEWKKDINLGDKGLDGSQLRPHIVWFGEAVPMMHKTADHVIEADYLVVIGTSLNVYPAALVFEYADRRATKYIVNPAIDNIEIRRDAGFVCFDEKATSGVMKAIAHIKESLSVNK